MGVESELARGTKLVPGIACREDPGQAETQRRESDMTRFKEALASKGALFIGAASVCFSPAAQVRPKPGSPRAWATCRA